MYNSIERVHNRQHVEFQYVDLGPRCCARHAPSAWRATQRSCLCDSGDPSKSGRLSGLLVYIGVFCINSEFKTTCCTQNKKRRADRQTARQADRHTGKKIHITGHPPDC